MQCPLRTDQQGRDSWKEARCSFCGSLHPGLFLDYFAAGAELIGTDKKDKIYVRTPDGKKMLKFRMVHFWDDNWN